MPVHRVLVGDAEAVLEALLVSERVVSMVKDGKTLVVVTEPRAARTAPGDLEEREGEFERYLPRKSRKPTR